MLRQNIGSAKQAIRWNEGWKRERENEDNSNTSMKGKKMQIKKNELVL